MRELFTEFMTLSWSKGESQDRIKDILLTELILCRLRRDSLSIIFLGNGNQISIPWCWIDTFSSFNTIYGHQALHYWLGDSSDKIEKLIYYFLKLLAALATQQKQLILQKVYDICEVGTSEMRAWLKEEFDVEFKPITVTSIDSELKL